MQDYQIRDLTRFLGDSIKVAAATYAENLTIAINLSIAGSSAATTIIDGGGKNTVVMIANANAQVSLSKLTARLMHISLAVFIISPFAFCIGGRAVPEQTAAACPTQLWL